MSSSFTSVVCLSIALGATPDAGVLVLPPVDVALPEVESDPLPTSPVVRDPSATLTVRDAKDARAEGKDASLRGAAPNAVLVLLDGVPLAGPGAAMDLSRIPTSALERIEVLRGGGSARYSPGAMGEW